MTLNTYCSHCSQKFAEQKLYPRKCFHCGNDTYRNPIPVAVGIIPVIDSYVTGLVIIQRGNEPKKGGWAFPGGFIEYGETWKEALSREIKEELGAELAPEFSLKGIENSTGNNLIIFGQHKILDKIPDFTPNEEATAIRLYTNVDEELAFPTHTDYARKALKALLAIDFGVYT